MQKNLTILKTGDLVTNNMVSFNLSSLFIATITQMQQNLNNIMNMFYINFDFLTRYHHFQDLKSRIT